MHCDNIGLFTPPFSLFSLGPIFCLSERMELLTYTALDAAGRCWFDCSKCNQCAPPPCNIGEPLPPPLPLKNYNGVPMNVSVSFVDTTNIDPGPLDPDDQDDDDPPPIGKRQASRLRRATRVRRAGPNIYIPPAKAWKVPAAYQSAVQGQAYAFYPDVVNPPSEYLSCGDCF